MVVSLQSFQIFFTGHSNSFHIVQNYCYGNLIITWDYDGTFCVRMMKDQMISFLADKGTAETFKNSDLGPPIRWRNFIQEVSP